MTEISLTPKKMAIALEGMIRARQSTCIWGEPGISKSSIVKMVAEKLGLACIDVRAALLDPVDLRGLPHINGDGRSHWAIPEFLPRDGQGVLFLDEVNRAPVMVQNACFQLIQDRKLGEYTLPDGWVVIAACNREQDGGGVQRMPSALSNRFLNLNMVPDAEDWCEWAHGSDIEPVVIAFIKFRPTLLQQFDAKQRSFPTPRTWHFVSNILKQNLPEEIQYALIQGAVGEGAAFEFQSLLETLRSLPSIDAIILDPMNAPVPQYDVASLYAISAALSARANPENFGRVLQYLGRMPQEYEFFGVDGATTRDASLKATSEFTGWAVRHQAMFQ